jgi:hypothetical protein
MVPQSKLGAFGESEEEVGVPVARPGYLVPGGETFESILTDCLQEPIPDALTWLPVDEHQGRIGQSAEQWKDGC